MEYRQPYPSWILIGMDVLAAGILVASFRDAWSVVQALGVEQAASEGPQSMTMLASGWANAIVAGAVVLAIDAAILLLEQTRSQVKLRGGNTFYNDVWVTVLILISAMLNVRYLTMAGEMTDRIIGAILGVAIPSTIAVLGFLKGDMLAFNARCRVDQAATGRSLGLRAGTEDDLGLPDDLDEQEHAVSLSRSESTAPMFRIKHG